MYVAERLSRENGRDYALRIIKENIVRLELEPGSMVSENELAADLGLSRTPVREALIELSRVKIVEIYPQKGSFVALVDYSLVEESRFIRRVLEPAVLELDCERAKEEDLRSLEEQVRLQEFYLDNYYSESLMELDNQFHKMLFEIAGKSQAYAMMENLSIHFDRVRNMSLSSVKNGKIVQDHKDITSAVRERDPKRAREILESHLDRYKFDKEAIREQYPRYFK